VSSVHRVPFINVQLNVYIIKINIVLYTQLSHISLELLKHNIIAMCCHTMYLGKKFFFFTLLQKHCTLGKTPLLPLGHAHLLEVGGFIRVLGFPPSPFNQCICYLLSIYIIQMLFILLYVLFLEGTLRANRENLVYGRK
jgi:hypothetical protein